MNASSQDNSPIRFLVAELKRLRNARECRFGVGVVSWEISPSCRFITVMSVQSLTHYPGVGIAAPKAMRRVNELQLRSGLHMQKKVDWLCTPSFSVGIDALRFIDPGAALRVLPAFEVLHGAQPLDSKSASEILDALFFAESVLVEKAGTLEALVKFGSERLPQHPTMTYVIPVAYAMLGRWSEAEAYIDARVARYRSDDEPELLTAYQGFVRELKADPS